MICCTFAGHRDIDPEREKAKLRAELENLLERDEIFCFYAGAMGAYDLLCSETVAELKRAYPNKKIILTLVEPDMSMSAAWKRQYDQYDDVVRVAHRQAAYIEHPIIERNRWMVDHSQILIACVRRETGGAYRTFSYAHQNKLEMINIAGA